MRVNCKDSTKPQTIGQQKQALTFKGFLHQAKEHNAKEVPGYPAFFHKNNGQDILQPSFLGQISPRADTFMSVVNVRILHRIRKKKEVPSVLQWNFQKLRLLDQCRFSESLPLCRQRSEGTEIELSSQMGVNLDEMAKQTEVTSTNQESHIRNRPVERRWSQSSSRHL